MALSKQQGGALWEKRWPEWVKKASAKHAGRYQYPRHDRVEGKIEIICPDHGSFWQDPAKHVYGRGCPACAGLGRDRLIDLQAAYPDWNWTGVKLPGTSKQTFEFECPVHGTQKATINQLLTKQGTSPCPQCSRLAGAERISAAQWVDRISRKWGGEVTLDPSSVTTSQARAQFACRHHGAFTAILADVANGHGCPECGRARARQSKLAGFGNFHELAHLAHGTTYEYHPETFTDVQTATKITCSKHGDFWQIPRNHTTLGAGCPRCINSISRGEDEVAQFLEQLGLRVERRVRPTGAWELDIVLPDLMVAIEFCGIYWHGENFKSPSYHQNKLRQANDAGYRLVTIFSDEWEQMTKRVQAHLRAMAGLNHKVGARTHRVVKVGWAQARDFLAQFHLQGAGRPAAHCYALVDESGVINEVATWGTDRFSNSGAAELLRLCSRPGITVVGGVSKLVRAFQKDTGAQRLMTFADLRWGTGNAYGKVGFKQDGVTNPGYFWAKGTQRWSRVRFQKHKLQAILENFDPGKSEIQNCRDNGYWRVFDCGHSRWVMG